VSIESPPLERKLVAILAADVEGYSRMMHVAEEATLATLTEHRHLMDSIIDAAGGNITSTAGDSVLAEFASVVEAVECAVAIQTELAAANAGIAADQRMHFRIGINVGDVMVKDGGIFGDGVNVAARVESLAPPGGICVTRGVRDHVRDRLSYGFEDGGDHVVKNITRPVHVYRVIFDRAEVAIESRSVSLTSDAAGPSRGAADDQEIIFWKSVEQANRPEEYQAYLDSYPEGVFAALASTRVHSAAETASPMEVSVELAFWESVKSSENPAMLQAYLDKFPSGQFTTLATLHLEALLG
jgi:class 3 adenylate cyclase